MTFLLFSFSLNLELGIREGIRGLWRLEVGAWLERASENESSSSSWFSCPSPSSSVEYSGSERRLRDSAGSEDNPTMREVGMLDEDAAGSLDEIVVAGLTPGAETGRIQIISE